MVRGIDIQNVVANTQFATREQQIAQQQANFAPAHASQEAQKDEDVHKEQIRQSQQTQQEQSTIDPNRRERHLRRRRRRQRQAPASAKPSDEQLKEDATRPEDKGHLIDLEA